MQSTAVQMIAEVRARPEHAPQVAQLFSAFAEHVRQRPGCERVEVYRKVEEPETFVAVMAFADEAALQDHLDDAWRQQIVQRAGELLAERPRRFAMQRLA